MTGGSEDAAGAEFAALDRHRDYRGGALLEADVAGDPLVQFERWWREAETAGELEAAAMTLATVGADGAPAARIVYLRGVDARGFAFFTNGESRKGRELAAEPRAALCFFWPRRHRQVRVEGRVAPQSPAESDAYFAARPRGSRLGAWASPQSAPLRDRAELEARLAEVEARFPDAVPRPPHWGGYRLLPHVVEFWQGRESRLHDRLRYERTAAASPGWRIVRLAP
ncbi:MAG: pyridoxamine 5'-phosphate oxidase [Planctomycetes bacterium]|nr:pyridoxamine 5'-phosphate oxidase [Planctomycetota bacterium]